MKTLKTCILTIFCIAMALPAVANDGTYYTRGNQLIPLQETDTGDFTQVDWSYVRYKEEE